MIPKPQIEKNNYTFSYEVKRHIYLTHLQSYKTYMHNKPDYSLLHLITIQIINMLSLLFIDNKAETRTLQVVVIYLFYYYKVILYYCNNVSGIVDMLHVKDCLITVVLRLIILSFIRQNTEVLLTIKVTTQLQCGIQVECTQQGGTKTRVSFS